jgi:hypothetical protein
MTVDGHAGPTAVRDKVILAGLYLSKYDSPGLRQLGFESFVEAFNVIGYALGSKPASIKNYRDEFDPMFPNRRKGWHKRPIREYCLKVAEEYGNMDFDAFTALIRSFAGYAEAPVDFDPGESPFAQRLITGLAAERYFESVQPDIPDFKDYLVENTTRFGCGYDFRLRTGPNDGEFLAVEVKGLKERTGSLLLTPREYETAAALGDRFFLFVVKNFRDSPHHEIFQNPLAGKLKFARTERVLIQISWQTVV